MTFDNELREAGILISNDDAIKHARLEEESKPKIQIPKPIISVNNVDLRTENILFKSVRLNTVTIGLYNDEFQKIFMDSLLLDSEITIDAVTIEKEQDLKKLLYLTKKSIFNEQSIVKLYIKTKLTNPILEFIHKIYLKNKALYIFLGYNKSIGFLSRNLDFYYKQSISITEMHETTDYNLKKELIEKTLDNWRINTKNKEVRSILVKVLISRIDDFETLKTSLDVARLTRVVITEEYLEEIAGNVDFYKLDDLFEMLLRGKSKKKAVKYIYYFIETKKYHPNWLLNKFRDYLLMVNDIYTLKYRGILKHTTDKWTLEQRLNYTNISNKKDILKLNKKEQQTFLDYTEDIPYQYISEILKLTMNKKYLNVDKILLYQYINELYLKQKPHIDAEGQKGFINNRQLQNIKANAKYRKKRK